MSPTHWLKHERTTFNKNHSWYNDCGRTYLSFETIKVCLQKSEGDPSRFVGLHFAYLLNGPQFARKLDIATLISDVFTAQNAIYNSRLWILQFTILYALLHVYLPPINTENQSKHCGLLLFSVLLPGFAYKLDFSLLRNQCDSCTIWRGSRSKVYVYLERISYSNRIVTVT